jgi:cytoskeletal protein RodZ
MRARITKLMVGLSAFGALAVGGASLATAANSNPPVTPAVASAPADTTQQGDQSAPESTGASAESASESASSEAASTSESASPNDGPGGHADDPANAGVDNQFQGEQ